MNIRRFTTRNRAVVAALAGFLLGTVAAHAGDLKQAELAAKPAAQTVRVVAQGKAGSYADGWRAAQRHDADMLGHRMPNADESEQLRQARRVSAKGWTCVLEWDGPAYPGYEAVCTPKRRK